MEITQVKAAELIIDWSLWPRHEASNPLDVSHIAQLKEAMKAGIKLPPIKVDKNSMKVVDGFHRRAAAIKLYGEDATIDALLIDYKDEKEMFLDAVRENAKHGLKLSPLDRAHVMLKGRRKNIPDKELAIALGFTEKDAEAFLSKRSAMTSSGDVIPLPGGARNLAGRKLTKAQEKFAKKSNGMLPIVNARLLLNAFKAKWEPDGEKQIKIIEDLSVEINKCLIRITERKAAM